MPMRVDDKFDLNLASSCIHRLAEPGKKLSLVDDIASFVSGQLAT
jgi:hypothetical protein